MIRFLSLVALVPTLTAQTLPAEVFAGADGRGLSRPAAATYEQAGMAATPWTQQAKITAADAAEGDQFGTSIAVDGDVAIIGAPTDDGAGRDSGAVYVVVRSGDSWVQQVKLIARDTAGGDLFGSSVAFSGETAIIGAPGDDDAGTDSGAAYVFVRSDGVWVEQAKITARSAHRGDLFGISVALSGETTIVGASGYDGTGSDSGGAYVFVRSGATWEQQTMLTAGDSDGRDQFGKSVAFSGDTAIVGAPTDDDEGLISGSAYVFVRSGAAWTQQVKLNATDSDESDQFATSVAVDGDVAVIGAPTDDGAGTDSGAAYVFVRSGTAWVQQVKLTAHDADRGERFGISVALLDETAVIGAYGDESFAGSAYVFIRTDGAWAEQAMLTVADAVQSDAFGIAVALSGETAVVGAIGDASSAGSAYVFAPPTSTANEDSAVLSTVSLMHPNPTSGWASFSVILSEAGQVRAAVYDALGREVTVLHDGPASGHRTLSVDAGSLPPGVYVVRVVGPRLSVSKTLIVAR